MFAVTEPGAPSMIQEMHCKKTDRARSPCQHEILTEILGKSLLDSVGLQVMMQIINHLSGRAVAGIELVVLASDGGPAFVATSTLHGTSAFANDVYVPIRAAVQVTS